MNVGQAVFSSQSSRSGTGTKLVGRSPDISDPLLAALEHWCPEYWELADGLTESISFFCPSKDKLVIARSVICQPEYGRPNEMELLTFMVVFEPAQLKGFQNNAALFAHVLLTSGLLYNQSSIAAELAIADVPERSNLPFQFRENWPDTLIKTVSRAIDIHDQVAILGPCDALAFCVGFLSQLPDQHRVQTSFTTGTKVSEKGKFNLYFYAEPSQELKNSLVKAQVRTVALETLVSC